MDRRDKEEAHCKSNEMAKEGRTNSNLFWKYEREEEGGREKEQYDVITEDGRVIEDAEEPKEHIANYCEQLYQGRKGKPEYSQWTQIIKKNIQEIEDSLKDAPSNQSANRKLK